MDYVQLKSQNNAPENYPLLVAFGGSGAGASGMRLTSDFTNRASWIRRTEGISHQRVSRRVG